MRYVAFVGGVLGLALLAALLLRTDLSALLHAMQAGGWSLGWLAPYRLFYYGLYAVGWWVLLRPADPAQRADLGYLFWVTLVRDAVDRLLPVASVGGSVIGIRLVGWRGLATATVGATVIVEIVLTLIAVYLFAALGISLLAGIATGQAYRHIVVVLVITLPVPVITLQLLRHGSAMTRLQKFLRPVLGANTLAAEAAAFDHALRALLHRTRSLTLSTALQFCALLSGTLETWFALRLFGHPVTLTSALVLESTTTALRHLAFMVPAGLGVQEAGFIWIGNALGITNELALAVSMAKRLRELLCGVPALLSWQWLEASRLSKPGRSESNA
jgi:putative membrane protein